MTFKWKVFSSVTVNWKETKTEREFTDINEYNKYIKENHLDVEIPEFKMPDFDSFFSSFDSLFWSFDSIFSSSQNKTSEFKEYEDELRHLENQDIKNKRLSRLQSFRDRFKKLWKEDRVKELDEKIKSLKK